MSNEQPQGCMGKGRAPRSPNKTLPAPIGFPEFEPKYTTKEAASILRCSTTTLEIKRCHGGGPEFEKVGGRVLYTQSALKAYIGASFKHTGESEAAA